MRLKTFIATYLLFLTILFSSVGIVSTYLTNSQINMLEDKSAGQFQVIMHTLVRDISLSWGRYGWGHGDFSDTVSRIVDDYARYYSRHNVHIFITDLARTQSEIEVVAPEMAFIQRGEHYYIHAQSTLPAPFEHFLFDYRLNITENIVEMRSVQNVLLVSAIIFSIVAAFALNLILASIFKPLNIVANASREIAEGKFGERIPVRGNNELSQVAYDFNKMAERVEDQIAYLEEEAQNKQQFVDNFAHEIRTPLTSIYGYAEYLQKTTLDEKEIIESSEYIMSEAAHMKNIANSLLELATLRDYVPVKDEIQVSKLFDDIAGTLEQLLHERGVGLICDNDIDIINAQEDLIKSLLLNLCTNAIKACASDEGIVWLKAHAHADGIVVSVSDNGCGIPEESLQKVTEPFYRLDKSRNREHGGTGLGLTLCSQIAAVHKAEMIINSSPGAGTTIDIIFTNLE